MFYVYYGYLSSDNVGEGPTHSIKEFKTAEEVANFKKEFDENIYKECAHVEFRVFDGVERTLKVKSVIQTYELVENIKFFDTSW